MDQFTAYFKQNFPLVRYKKISPYKILSSELYSEFVDFLRLIVGKSVVIASFEIVT